MKESICPLTSLHIIITFLLNISDMIKPVLICMPKIFIEHVIIPFRCIFSTKNETRKIFHLSVMKIPHIFKMAACV